MLPHMRRSLIHFAPALVVAVLLGACSGGEQQADGSASPGATPAASASPAPSLEPSGGLPVTTVTLRSPDGATEVDVPVYVAADQATRGRGLMERDDLPDGTGMLFLFPGESSGAFYMFQTLIPLSIAFYAEDGTVVRVLDMEPCTEEVAAACELYPPGVPYRGALEVEQGWFDEVGLTESWTVTLPADLPTPS